MQVQVNMENKQTNTPRRGRPPRSQEQITASRNIIIQAARDLFVTHGYAGVSMRKIAAKADCLPATLYTLFPSKRHLLHHIWEVTFLDLIVKLEECYKNTPESKRLENLCLTQINFWLDRPDDCRAIFLIEDHPQSAEEHYFVDDSQAVPQLEIYTRAIQEAQMRGEIRLGNPNQIKSVLLCSILGIVLSLIGVPEYPWGDPTILKEMTIRALITGMK
ncbi:TetR/AcrR family transcriptional regulator [Acinetobacter sp. NIPH 2699]|uniref:TetR/AcrR family transcriptional regulator n=1 Tax=Acinetobacter sp. NIPH 2699 TaxID=2923433 RepID=UPI001F4A763C|nr:TetR/AcrR family transcriptional regulator [Acinetobacter sp. NIPH 2699]MCH7335084.1 TetR/AcrR family transcriptional regulator [Acinetobacter sp. NIPH 2699]